MAKSDELVKYITQRVVHYIDTPKEERERSHQKERAVGDEVVWYDPFRCIPVGGEKEKEFDTQSHKRSSSGKG